MFDTSEAERQFLTHNPALLAALDVHLDAAGGGADGLGHRARVVVSRRLRGRRPTLEEVSAELAISSRSLQRALRNEGSSFRSLLDEVRNRHALHYLRTTNFSDIEIAYLIGFQETSSFYRAFRSWNGGTPGELRRAPRA